MSDDKFRSGIREAIERSMRPRGQAEQKYRDGYERWIKSLKK